MSWASGSRIANDLIEVVNDIFTNKVEKAEFYEAMIEIFEEHDCDTLDECVGTDSTFDEVWEKLYPGDDDTWLDEDDE
jgi:hypothetical protein